MNAITLCTALLAISLPAQAHASVGLNYGILTCEANRAVVQFVKGYDDAAPQFPPLPNAVGPLNAPRVQGNRCQLADGREVLVKIGNTQARPYGMCGGESNGFASLWVDGRKVLSRMPVIEACFAEVLNDIFALEGETLTLCRTEAAIKHLMRTSLRASCDDETSLLSAAEPDLVEYPPDPDSQPAWGTMTILHAEDRQFCGDFIVPLTAGMSNEELADLYYRTGTYNRPASMQNANGFGPGVEGWNRRPRHALRVPKPAPLSWYGLDGLPAADEDNIRVAVAYFDFDNDGHADIVLRHRGQSGGFDGQVYYVATWGAAPAVEAEIERLRSAPATNQSRLFEVLESASGVFTYTGSFARFAPEFRDRYTVNTAFRAKGQILVYAAPRYPGGRPTAVIYRPQPGGQADPVCVFQRIEENY